VKILILSFYYQPDLCAGSFRCTALVQQLRQQADCEIEVITTLPNRYASYSAAAPEFEEQGNIRIHRVKLPAHKSGMVDQAKAFTCYYRKALSLTKDQRYDAVFATSSRLFTAFLGARIAVRKRIPLYLDIRDIFVDTMNDILPRKVAFLASPVLHLIEKYTFNKAKRINLVSKGFELYFNTYYPKTELRWFTNGIDDEFLAMAPTVPSEPISGRPIRVLCAGNIGEGQGLHTILPALGKRLVGRVEFKVIGDGGKKQLLQRSLSEQAVTNVSLCDPVGRQQLIKEYQEADILFLHLNDYPAFKKVLPSKIFEYATMGKPIWAGVAGYAAQFLKSEVDNVAVFYPGNDQEAFDKLTALAVADRPRAEFTRKYARATIMKEMAEDVVLLARSSLNLVSSKLQDL
jgi:hypothetical protein